MRIQLTAVLVLLFQLALNAQFETTYKPIVSHGTLPKDFCNPIVEKIRRGQGQVIEKRKAQPAQIERKLFAANQF